MAVSEALGRRRTVDLPTGTIEYRERGRGPVLLFVHGLLVNGDLWRKVVPALEERFRCITPDWPLGSHSIPQSADADLSPPGLARVVAAFLDRTGLEDATVVANDTGGALAQILITTHGERVRDVVLTPCDAYDNFPPRRFRYLLAAARLPGVPYLLAQTMRSPATQRLPIAFGPLTKHRFEKDIFQSFVRPPRVIPGVRRDLTKVLKGISPRFTEDAAPKLAAFEGRALIAWSVEDRLFPYDHARRLSKDFRNARLEPVEDSLTFVPEDQPARLAELITEFAGAGAPRS